MASHEASTAGPADRPLIRISRVASRYLLFDISDVMFLRRHHNLSSVFSGTVPQNPQQNVFMGLPVELMAEEARALVDDGAAYVADDADFHITMLKRLTSSAGAPAKTSVSGPSGNSADAGITKLKSDYLESITQEGTAVMQAHLEEKQALREASLLKASKSKKNKKGKRGDDNTEANERSPSAQPDEEQASKKDLADEPAKEEPFDDSLFGSPETSNPQQKINMDKAPPAPNMPYAVTPTTTGPLLDMPPSSSPLAGAPSKTEAPSMTPGVEVPPSYPLYKHLHDKGYYMMPGLRFGCDYNVYPGDPLRFHAHFQATSYGWDEEINMMDLTAGGRLGTGVKKGWLIGGQPPLDKAGSEDGNDDQLAEKGKREPARAFCLEWAGM